MSDSELTSIIRRVECFRQMDEEDVKQVAAMGRVVDYDGGVTIFREGDPAATSYVVISGDVSLEICAPGIGCRRISSVRDGEFLGWSPVLDNFQLTVTARAVVPTQMIELPKDGLLALCERSPRFGYVFMRGVAQTLAMRLSAARMQMLNLYGDESEPSSES